MFLIKEGKKQKGVKKWRERGKETKEIIILQRPNTSLLFRMGLVSH